MIFKTILYSLFKDLFYLYKQYRNKMKCSMMLHFIWVFIVCKNACIGVSPNTKVNIKLVYIFFIFM